MYYVRRSSGVSDVGEVVKFFLFLAITGFLVVRAFSTFTIFEILVGVLALELAAFLLLLLLSLLPKKGKG
jgi:hypothetical protein